MTASAWTLADLSLASWESLPLDTRIALAYAPYQGWPYRVGSRPAVAYESPAVPSSLVGPRDRGIDCSTMTASILTAVYPRAGWTDADYRDLQIFDASRKDSPMDAVERRGVGRRTPTVTVNGSVFGSFVPGRWHLVQGWRRKGTGHAYLVHAATDGTLTVVESTSLRGRGPRWRTTTESALRADYDAALYVAVLT